MLESNALDYREMYSELLQDAVVFNTSVKSIQSFDLFVKKFKQYIFVVVFLKEAFAPNNSVQASNSRLP